MEYFSQKLVRNDYIEKRIGTICSYNASKMEVIEGHIININKTNVSFIEPHKIIITTKEYKLLIIYYDKDNVFLYDRRMPIDIRKIETLLKHIRNEVA